MGYIRLGQQATTLSGGEAQRVKLATELSKAAKDHTVISSMNLLQDYILKILKC
ncbi:MAG: hypothetical protein CM1200mP10_05240 [Candidatus Neomarinimicrobiota bacterium]|nr:MAG: hypothetical protein CM1200mP10_05240 [Candidatus Neomarinimicrobiota bacterium]